MIGLQAHLGAWLLTVHPELSPGASCCFCSLPRDFPGLSGPRPRKAVDAPGEPVLSSGLLIYVGHA